MDFTIKDKVAIVGGSSKGLGKACAIALAKEGVNIVLCSNDEESLRNTKKEITNLGVQVEPLLVDMSLKEDNERIISSALKRFGRIDILVNNSGGPKPGIYNTLNESDWDYAYHAVLKYNIRMTEACIPHMTKNEWGRIINITSLSVKEPSPSLLLSNVFRSGVVSYAKSISKDLIAKGITINNISPGAFKTDRAIELLTAKAKELGISLEELEAQNTKKFPQGRYQEPKELGDLVCFLASDNASAITGTTIQIDGGISNSLF